MLNIIRQIITSTLTNIKEIFVIKKIILLLIREYDVVEKIFC